MADTVALILWGVGNTGSSDYTDVAQTKKKKVKPSGGFFIKVWGNQSWACVFIQLRLKRLLHIKIYTDFETAVIRCPDIADSQTYTTPPTPRFKLSFIDIRKKLGCCSTRDNMP